MHFRQVRIWKKSYLHLYYYGIEVILFQALPVVTASTSFTVLGNQLGVKFSNPSLVSNKLDLKENGLDQ
jgi:hypothetical protein